MSNSYKNGFEFVVTVTPYADNSNHLRLGRRNGSICTCPFGRDKVCGTQCPHFVIENCSIADKKCQLVLTCGKYTARYLEIVE